MLITGIAPGCYWKAWESRAEECRCFVVWVRRRIPSLPQGGGAKLLNPPINLTERGLAHTLERHAAGGAARFAGKSKFNAGEDVAALVRSGTQQPMVRQANGNFARTFDVGRDIGFDRNTGGPTSIMTIITRANGDLVTAFPGR